MLYIKTTIEDVAKKAGVSITTVSRVVNDNYPVSKETKARVLDAIETLEYTPNALARGLIQKKTMTIGVLTPSITNTYFSVVISGIQDYLNQKGYHIFLCDTGGKAKNEMVHIRRLQEFCVDGIISIDPRTENIKNGYYEKIDKQTPLVIINAHNKGVELNFVINDQEAGTYEALNYLYNLGHREIAFLKGPSNYSYDIKEEIYKRFLKEKKLELNKNNFIEIEKGNSIETFDLSYKAVIKRFSAKNKGIGIFPTAIFCCNDFMAVGALNGITQLGMTVPGDVSITGYDNTIVSQMTLPRVTTVDQKMGRLGKTSAERLMEIIEGALGYRKIILDTKLVIRDSCKENTE